jgi:hypothetical protein
MALYTTEPPRFLQNLDEISELVHELQLHQWASSGIGLITANHEKRKLAIFGRIAGIWEY